MKIDNQNQFFASWNANNAQLNPNQGSALRVLARKVAYCIFYLPHSLIAACVNPRSESSFAPYHSKNIGYETFAKQIITPDRVSLTSEIHVIDAATPQTPTVILFNPLATEKSVHRGLQDCLINKKCNVVLFNYRGLGSTRRAEDLVLDGESIYQYVTQELGTTASKVHMFGFSMGGSLAAQVKALHPESEGKYVGDRAFKSIFSLLTEFNLQRETLGGIIGIIMPTVIKIFLAMPIYLLGWEWDGNRALDEMKGETLLVYHPKDVLILFKASLASVCSLNQVISLADGKPPLISTHFAPIDSHLTSKGDSAVEVVADFLAD